MMGWLGYMLTITGLILAGRRNVACWPVWLCSNVAWIISAVAPYNPQIILCNLTLFFFNFAGWLNWTKKTTSS